LYEDFPANYLAYARRAHRWIRGDWQLLSTAVENQATWRRKSRPARRSFLI